MVVDFFLLVVIFLLVRSAAMRGPLRWIEKEVAGTHMWCCKKKLAADFRKFWTLVIVIFHIVVGFALFVRK